VRQKAQAKLEEDPRSDGMRYTPRDRQAHNPGSEVFSGRHVARSNRMTLLTVLSMVAAVVGLVGIAAIVLLVRRAGEAREFGSVSEQWIAEYRAGQAEGRVR
jgi:hypothetical protein